MDQYHDHITDQKISIQDNSGWTLIKSYWRAKQRFPAYVFFSVFFGMTMLLVASDFIFNYWYYTYFYNALQSYNKHGLIRVLSFFCILSTCYLVLGLHRYVTTRLINRQWLSSRLIACFIEKTNAKRKQSAQIQKDTITFIDSTLDFTMALVIAITTFSAFMYYFCLLMDEIAAKFGMQELTNGCIAGGLFFALAVTCYLIKRGCHLIPLAEPPVVENHPNLKKCSVIHSEAREGYLDALKKNWSLWLLAGHSVIYVIFSLLLILPGYVEQLYLLIAVLYSLQAFLRGQHFFLWRLTAYFKN